MCFQIVQRFVIELGFSFSYRAQFAIELEFSLTPFSTEFGLLSNSVLAFRSKERDLVLVLVPRVLSLPLSRCRERTLGMRLGPNDKLSQEMLYERFLFGVIFICAAKKR